MKERKKKGMSIRSRLILTYLAIGIIPSVAFGTVLLFSNRYRTNTDTEAAINSNINLAVNGLSNEISHEESTISLFVNSLGYNTPFVSNIPDLNSTDTAVKEKAQNEVYNAIVGNSSETDSSILKTVNYLITSDDMVEKAQIYSEYTDTSINNILFPVRDEAIKQYYLLCKNNTSESFWEYKEDKNELNVYHSILDFSDPDIPQVGMFKVRISLLNFLRPLSTSYRNNGYLLFDSNAKLISSRNSGYEDTDKYITSSYNSSEALKAGESHNGEAFISIKKEPITGLTLLYYVSNDEVRPYYLTGLWQSLVVVAATILLASVVAVIISKHFSRRIEKLDKGANEIAEGDYGYQVDFTGNDELSSLAEAFNTMSDKVKKTLGDMVIVQDNVSQTFAEILEAKSGQSGHHVKRVSEYTGVLAHYVGFSEEEIHDIKIAAMLHDCGKIMIPNEILEKPGRLTEEEFSVMKKHVVYGEQMLRNCPGEIMNKAALIAGDHHERWDGTGYVKSLKGDEIPLIAQIASVADVFDALVSYRSYKKPWSFEDARKEIVSQRGKQFSPRAVDAFIKAYPEMVKIALKYPDGHKKESEEQKK